MLYVEMVKVYNGHNGKNWGSETLRGICSRTVKHLLHLNNTTPRGYKQSSHGQQRVWLVKNRGG